MLEVFFVSFARDPPCMGAVADSVSAQTVPTRNPRPKKNDEATGSDCFISHSPTREIGEIRLPVPAIERSTRAPRFAYMSKSVTDSGALPRAIGGTRVYSGNSRRSGAMWPKRPVADDGGNEMAKGQVKKEKTNKKKLSPKEKKANKAIKKAAKAAK